MWSTNPEGTTQRTATTPGNFTPYSFRIVCGFLNVPHWTYKHGRYCETGLTVYSPYPGRQRQHFLLSNFKTLSVGLAGGNLTTSRVTARCSTHWPTGAPWLLINNLVILCKHIFSQTSPIGPWRASQQLAEGHEFLSCLEVFSFFFFPIFPESPFLPSIAR